MLARILRLHLKTYTKLIRLSKEAERKGVYRISVY